ncbi:glycoside hydrolase superfamily [Crepidotus variabilis]|uniref:mannan endo-1,4-beta-mannosidase n=1 Tax=Crepidotus variabilis TaxID=179855 RepID=A0A9P6E575_9AGAR|nr:glycoside hydrolase superfamily [Crepidotus variabilis]
MKTRLVEITATIFGFACLPKVYSTMPLYGQCGGKSCHGGRTCANGNPYIYQNDWYSQCMVSSHTTTSSIASTSTTTSDSLEPSSTAPPSLPSAVPPQPPPGFVGVQGTQFVVDGVRFPVVGENAYWVGLTGLGADQMKEAFADIAATGATVVRTWGFSDITTSNSSGVYYQSWSGQFSTANRGEDGMGNFDKVVAAAKANGLRLIVPLSNNWSDYGGMDVYVKQIANSTNHDLFYSDPDIKNAFKYYAHAFMGRYITEPTIMAWELANEPRCKGSSGMTSGNCNPAMIADWAREVAAFIKSIDPYHLIGIGDEGFFNHPGASTYPYQGTEGIDFDANLQISSIDFGTFHLYPSSWGQSGNELDWGNKWIEDHAASMRKANKPVILEEFGVTSDQLTIYSAWLKQVISTGITGDLIWQSGSRLPGWTSPDDGYTVYPDSPVYDLLKQHAVTLQGQIKSSAYKLTHTH